MWNLQLPPVLLLCRIPRAPNWGSNCLSFSGNPNWDTNCLGLSGNPNWDTNCFSLSGNPNLDSNCPCRGPNNSCLSMTSDYCGFNRNSDHRRDEMEDRRQRDKEKQVSPIPGICAEQQERLRNSHSSCYFFMKYPPGEIISLWELISLFLSRNTKNQGG